jgi:hypothetical protein
VLVTIVLVSVLVGCASQASEPLPSYCYENSSFGRDEPESEHQYICHVPLEALVANPKDYDGFYIYSDGFLKFEYHGDYLYLSCTDAQAGRWTGRIGIRDQEYDMSLGFEPYEGWIYFVVGTFSYADLAIRNARLHWMPPSHDDFDGCEFDVADTDIEPLEQSIEPHP